MGGGVEASDRALAKRAAQQKEQQQKQNVDEADFEGFDACCKRLVAYIMATSPEFTQQMDHIILLSHSDAPERMLRSIATKNVWFHRRDALALPSGADDGTDDVETAYELATGSDHVESQASGNQVKTEAQGGASLPPVQPAAVEAKPKNPVADFKASTLRTNSQPAAASNSRSEVEQEEKRDEEEDTEEEVDVEADDTLTEEEDKTAVISNKPPVTKEHLGDLPDFLLNFDDPIRELCDVDKRARAQTKVFKERLRKAIRFVDAQLCKPPPGKACTRECKKLRDVMCAHTIPCSNATYRLWRDVEVHIGRCKNAHCELWNRVVLRETWYTIDVTKPRIQSLKTKLQAKQREFDLLKMKETNRGCERERLLEVTLVQNDISELKRQIAAEEEELETHEDVVAEPWACLNKVGIELKDDVADGFPDLATHYASKKKQAAVKPSADRARRSETSSNTALPMLNPAVGLRTLRRARRASTQTMDIEVIDVDSESGENGPPNKRLVSQEADGGSKNDRQNPKGGPKK